MVINIMLTRLLSALICAVTVLVTAQLLPNAAQAHGGHDHAVAVTSPDHVTNTGLHGVDATGSAKTQRAAEHTEVAPSDTIPATPSGACTGSCCGNGVACCGAAFLFPPAVALPDIDIGRQPAITASSAPSGIDPDALRKPPKSLA